MVEETIDLDQLDNHNIVIKPEYDNELKKISEKLTEVGRSSSRFVYGEVIDFA